jgi:hypothetical protein
VLKSTCIHQLRKTALRQATFERQIETQVPAQRRSKKRTADHPAPSGGWRQKTGKHSQIHSPRKHYILSLKPARQHQLFSDIRSRVLYPPDGDVRRLWPASSLQRMPPPMLGISTPRPCTCRRDPATPIEVFNPTRASCLRPARQRRCHPSPQHVSLHLQRGTDASLLAARWCCRSSSARLSRPVKQHLWEGPGSSATPHTAETQTNSSPRQPAPSASHTTKPPPSVPSDVARRRVKGKRHVGAHPSACQAQQAAQR